MPQPHAKAEAAIAKSEAAHAAFCRIGEEFKTMRQHVPAGDARDRLDRMIELNRTTAEAVKRTLNIRQGDLDRSKGASDAPFLE
jgi:hypothetical protein